jgi:predicted acyltransferase
MSEQQRYLALDVFRGMTICFMIIVNSPGSWDIAYAPLLHAPWHGFTPTDLVFPSFLFAVGNAMAFTMPKYEAQGSAAFWRKTIKRTLIIFLLGYLMYWFPFFQGAADGGLELKPIGDTRIMGVLQRIALCYFFASVILHLVSKKVALLIGTGLLLGYWILAYVFGDTGDPYSLTGNAALKFDLAVFGPRHLYHGEGIPFDPEGLLSTLPAIVNVLIGYFAGTLIRKYGNSYETIAKLMLAGAVMIFIALVWDMTFPINKKLWTSSFVLLTSGLALQIISILIYFIELLRRRELTYFFVVFGRNPLFIYLLSEIFLITLYLIPVGEGSVQSAIYDFLKSFASPINASLLFALLLMLFCWGIGLILDKRGVYIKV